MFRRLRDINSVLRNIHYSTTSLFQSVMPGVHFSNELLVIILSFRDFRGPTLWIIMLRVLFGLLYLTRRDLGLRKPVYLGRGPSNTGLHNVLQFPAAKFSGLEF